MPSGLKKQNAANAIEFLKQLKDVCVAPVFIFTNEDTSEIENELKTHADLWSESNPSHILVRSKADVTVEGIFEMLAAWMRYAPSVYVLKKWERAYSRAKNELFLDFYARNVHWPLVLWETYMEDSLDGSVELGNLIGRNLLSRMTPFHFDLKLFESTFNTLGDIEGRNRTAVQQVLEGERFLPRKRLQDDSIAPGDVFKRSGEFYIT